MTILRFALVLTCLLVASSSVAQPQAPPAPAASVPCEQVLGGYATALENLGRRAQQAEQKLHEAESKLSALTKKDDTKKPDEKK